MSLRGSYLCESPRLRSCELAARTFDAKVVGRLVECVKFTVIGRFYIAVFSTNRVIVT